jgi:hypothetical protein
MQESLVYGSYFLYVEFWPFADQFGHDVIPNY